MPTERIVDVNINRLQDGLKAIEDIIRFGSKNLDLLSRIRRIRMKTTKILKDLDYTKVVRGRRVDSVPGKSPKFDLPKKGELKILLIKSFARAKQSSRILEELKSKRWKKIRFDIYQLEKLALSPKFTFDPKFYAIWDERYLYKDSFLKHLEILIKGGVTTIQFRVKNLSDQAFLRLLNKARREIPEGIAMIVNNRLDLALACDADGVHLGTTDLPVREARRIGGTDMIIGSTVRSSGQLRKVKNYVDYLGVGSIFPSPTKPNARVIGIKNLKKIAKSSKKPIVAIGGIDLNSIPRIFKAGAQGLAVASALFEGNLKKNTKRFAQAIRNSSGSR